MRTSFMTTLVAVLLTVTSCSKASPPPQKDQVAEALAQPSYVILDVRGGDEFAEQHVEGAVHLPVAKIAKVAELIPDKDQQIIVHCASGVRSAKAAIELKNMGYTKILDLQSPGAVAKATEKPMVK